MELHGDNPFKIKSIAAAAFKMDKLPYSIAGKSVSEIEQIEGLGKSTATKIGQLLTEQEIPELNDLLLKTPPGVVEIMQIKGLGPKKVKVIWEDLGIESVGELYYACNENRLIEAKGFGLKTQEEIKKGIEFKMASDGRFLYARIENFAGSLITELRNELKTEAVFHVGQYRRRCEIIDSLDILLVTRPADEIYPLLEKLRLGGIEMVDNILKCRTEEGIKLNLIFCAEEDMGWQLILHTGNILHTNQLISIIPDISAVRNRSEEDIYQQLAGLPYIEPELREGLNEFELARKKAMPELIRFEDLRGTLHNHSTWSDGVHTLEEMAIFCRDELKLEYLGICDHSKSAFYANGLDERKVLAQQQEIDDLNTRLQPFRIFKGIESDILFDGSLDYESETLATFDFIVASVHSNFRMDEEKATARLIKAIENPYTTILGHPTGRLLLSRSGYPIDHFKIIDACAANQVIIEINANPLRLDLDWRWHQYALEKGVMLSINPDAHRKTGFYDMHYGILIARKGGLSKDKCLNAMTLDQVEAIFNRKKARV